MQTDNPRRRVLASLVCAIGALVAAGGARADLREPQVLVLYDSRVSDSVAVAEHYAGSANVPGGAGGVPGVHPGVHSLDIATLPGAGTAPMAATISYPDFIAKLRDPLRGYLGQSGLTQRVRCIVMTKGLPHRIQDLGPNPNAGDQPSQAAALINAGNLTYASVDSELTLLWQNLSANEQGNGADSKADGGVLNPYFKSSQSATAYSSVNISVAKTLLTVPGNVGILWRTLPSGPTGLTPGDFYLVCRLDGNSIADTIAAIDRAQNIAVDLDNSVMVLDESASDGVQNVSDTDGELDNDGPVVFTNAGDDYEQTRDLMLGDGRFSPLHIDYNRWSTAAQFIVGPRINFGGGVVEPGNVLLLATYGANHSGVPGTPGNAGTQYPRSFFYAPGAAFNTIESYNGRSFGGIGVGPVPQGQLADFLTSGGTFGLGNVWEPFSFTVPDNLAIVRNFYLGSLTWGEAAYTAMPMLSWQQVVVGDPLAKVRRVQEDVNADQRTDADDLYAWYASPSNPRDLNRDGQINRADVELLMRSVRGNESGNMREP